MCVSECKVREEGQAERDYIFKREMAYTEEGSVNKDVIYAQ